jgi:hypothetical protein
MTCRTVASLDKSIDSYKAKRKSQDRQKFGSFCARSASFFFDQIVSDKKLEKPVILLTRYLCGNINLRLADITVLYRYLAKTNHAEHQF